MKAAIKLINKDVQIHLSWIKLPNWKIPWSLDSDTNEIYCFEMVDTQLKYDDNKEKVSKYYISLSIKANVQLFLFVRFKYYFILKKLILSFYSEYLFTIGL